MAEEKQKLTIEAGLEGGQQTAQGLDQIDKAQEKVTDGTKAAEKPTEALADAQDKAAASAEEYTSLLSQMHPALGGMADMMVKGSKIIGDFAAQEINVTEITKKATTAFNENAKTIGLLGGAAVAAAGFVALAKAMAYVREESVKLQARLDELEGRTTTAQQEVIAGEQRVIEAARARREGPPGAEEAAGMRQMYREFRRADRIPPELLGELETNIATLYGVATREMIEALTLGGRELVDPQLAADARGRRAMRAVEAAEEPAARVREEYRARRQREREQAQEELLDPDITRGRAHITGEMERMGLEGDQELIQKVVRRVMEWRRTHGERFRGYSLERQVQESLERESGFLEMLGTIFAGPSQEQAYAAAGAEQFLRGMDARRGPRTVNNTTNINPRFTYPDANTRRRETRNGQTYRTRIGEG